jgi:hypothetical protein
MVMYDHVPGPFLAGVFPTNERDLSILSRPRRAIPSFASQVVFQLRPNMTVTASNSAFERL